MAEWIDVHKQTGCTSTLSEVSPLCDVCRSFFDEIEIRLLRDSNDQIPSEDTTDVVRSLWHGLTDLRFCAGLGCRLCAFALASIGTEDLERLNELPSHSLRLGAARDNADGLLLKEGQQQHGLARQDRRPAAFRFYLVDIQDKSGTGDPFLDSLVAIKGLVVETMIKFDIGLSTGSDHTFGKIRQWLNMCKTHEYCNEWHKIGGCALDFSPTRLLNIDGTAARPTVKLVEGSDIPPQPAYATLSHCWGSVPTVNLLKSNIEAYSECIPWETLPRTFREAVSAALRLEIQYLWIDALCILQDDTDDWAREAQMMAVVYANSALNISADASSDGSEGLYRDLSVFFEIPVLEQDGGSRAIRLYRDDWSSDVEHSPLAKRAWVVQERFLAPRVVHFGERQIFWECIEMSTLGSLPSDVQCESNNAYTLERHRIREKARSFSGSQLYDLWCSLLWLYSRGQLTIASDRPIALIGFAKAYMHLCGWQESDYLFGLWKPQLVHFLPWQPYKPSQAACALEQFPSWSWLSTDQGVQVTSSPYFGWSWEEVASVVDASVPSIRIRGPLCRATAFRADRPFRQAPLELGSMFPWLLTVGVTELRQDEHFRMIMDSVTEPELDGGSSTEVFLLLLRAQSTAGDEKDSDGKSTMGDKSLLEAVSVSDAETLKSSSLVESFSDDGNLSDVESVLLTRDSPSAPRTRGPSFHDGRYECLILQPTGMPGYFRRVGYVFVEGTALLWGTEITEAESEANMRFACCALDEHFQSSDIPAELYHEVDENFMHTITLI